jgi:diaminohydroxyphosphoribosylaminopyrimidine deaminase/5-amino-6-(5-phosphoribosylamino)uracil reductase
VPNHHTDEQFLRRALDLARQGLGLASPNPHVGAVVVDPDGKIAGEATYTYADLKHAEVIALAQAGAKSRGGTLYINLEPHSHQGRTPPCTDALIAAGIQRVVASMPDPNPKVSGRGFERLRAAGVKVEVGLFEAEARRLNESFARYIRHGVPFVTLKSAMSLDGKIALSPLPSAKRAGAPSGEKITREWITGKASRAHVHLQRQQSDAILVGIGTILADDPLLTDRSGNPRRRPLLRVILDSQLRLPLESRIVQSVGKSESENGLLIFCSSAAPDKTRELEARGIRVVQLPSASEGRLDLHAVLHHLGQLEITSVMIEGGATVNAAALTSGVVDKLFLYYAPTILGAGGVSFSADSLTEPLRETLRPRNLQLHRFGDDIAVEGYLRDPYGD